MKKVVMIKLGLQGLTPAALVEKGRNLIQKCTGNPNLTLPADFLTEFTAAVDALEMANLAVLENGGRKDHALRGLHRVDVENCIRKLSALVEEQCFADVAKILSTGFDLRREPAPLGLPPAPTNLRARRGVLGGEVDLIWDSARGRLFYEAQVNDGDPNVEENWRLLVQTSKNRYVATGLRSDHVYYFRVRAVGTAGAGPLSDSAVSKAA